MVANSEQIHENFERFLLGVQALVAELSFDGDGRLVEDDRLEGHPAYIGHGREFCVFLLDPRHVVKFSAPEGYFGEPEDETDEDGRAVYDPVRIMEEKAEALSLGQGIAGLEQIAVYNDNSAEIPRAIVTRFVEGTVLKELSAKRRASISTRHYEQHSWHPTYRASH
jgi:hypothetical protein